MSNTGGPVGEASMKLVVEGHSDPHTGHLYKDGAKVFYGGVQLLGVVNVEVEFGSRGLLTATITLCPSAIEFGKGDPAP